MFSESFMDQQVLQIIQTHLQSFPLYILKLSFTLQSTTLKIFR